MIKEVSVLTHSTEEWTKELIEIRQMVEFLVGRETMLDMKTDVAFRRLERLAKENDQLQVEEHEASLTEALADRTKVVKLVVDKWFAERKQQASLSPYSVVDPATLR